MDEVLNIALIGCGGMMHAHVSGFRELWEHEIRDFRITACCDVNLDAAKSLAAEVAEFQGHQPQCFGSLDDLLASSDLFQACDVSVVHRDHHTVAVPCLQAGKHVLIEKPLAITMRAARLILDAATQAGVKLGVAENYRRAPHERAINWAVRQGQIGEPWMFFWIDAGLRLWYWTWREHRMEAGAGWTLDGGVHFADLFRYHVGPVQEVCAVTRAFWPYRYSQREPLGGDLIEVDVEDTMVAILKFERPNTIGQ
ncbi:MAG: Gfo/Idh/MocA family oxidoreductase, partial [Armatimonadetes bacterium]|nr:Gfo/Idh/MocA family oxidoreductase [Armatimonadota bacterium]